MLKWHVYKKQRLAVQYITYAAKQTQLRDREATLKLQLDGVDRGKDENAELAGKVFELSPLFVRNGLQPIQT
jgi:lipase chaperone LimK